MDLKEPDFAQDDIFKTIIWRTRNVTTANQEDVTINVDKDLSGEVSGEVSGGASGGVSE